MKWFSLLRIMPLLIGLAVVLLVATGLTQSSGIDDTEVIIKIAGEEHHYQPRPELGYVIKIRQEYTNANAPIRSSTEATLPDNAVPIGGLGRRGIWVVENECPEVLSGKLYDLGPIAYQAPLFSVNGETVAVIPEIVVRVTPEIQAEQVQALCEKVGCSIIKPMEFTTQEYLLEVLCSDAEAVFTAVEQLNEDDSVEWAAPNTAFQPKLFSEPTRSDYTTSEQPLLAPSEQDANNSGVFPNDEYFPMQWHLHNTGQSGGTPGVDIRAPEAWEITTGDPNIVVAMIDCGVDVNHPDLMNNLVAGYDFVENDELPDPGRDQSANAHGTACAGLVSAQGNNGTGLTGVTWDCKLMPIRIVRGQTFVTMADLATSFRWAASHGADIFSDSSTYYSSPQPIVRSAIVDVTMAGGIGRNGKGCVFLTATANSSGPMEYPEKYPEVISVSPTDHTDIRCAYSSHGPELDLVAPSAPSLKGADKLATKGRGWIWTTDITGSLGFSSSSFNPYPDVLDYTLFTGSSAACPIAAGVAALILSIEPNLTSDEVRHFLERSAKDLGDPGRDDYYGWGRVDARAALDMVLAKRCDLNNDWKVDEQDLALLNEYIDANDLSGDIAPAAKRDGKVNEMDIDLFMQYIGTEIPELYSLAHWKLDESEGTTAYECINHRDGTLQGGPVWQPESGIIDGALELDGINDYVSTPFILNPYSGPFSVFAWIKSDIPGKVIISQKNGANWLLADSSGKLITELKATGTAGRTLISQTVITDGNWHRIGLVRDGTNRILYVDDVEVGRDTQINLAGSTQGLYIGAGKGLESGKFFSGLIDDVRIYNRAIIP